MVSNDPAKETAKRPNERADIAQGRIRIGKIKTASLGWGERCTSQKNQRWRALEEEDAENAQRKGTKKQAKTARLLGKKFVREQRPKRRIGGRKGNGKKEANGARDRPKLGEPGKNGPIVDILKSRQIASEDIEKTSRLEGKKQQRKREK